MSFRMNPRFLPALAVSAEMANVMQQGAEATAQEARNIAPVLTGAYRDSIHAEIVFEGGMVKGRVIADDEASPYIEFGTSDTPTFAPLRKALMAVFGH